MIQDSISIVLSSTKSQTEFTLPPNYIEKNQYNRVSIAEISIPISFYSIPTQMSFIIKKDLTDHVIIIKEGSPSLQQFIDLIQIQLDNENLGIIIREDEELGYIDFVSNNEFELIIPPEKEFDDVRKYLGFPIVEAVPDFPYSYVSSKIVDFISHQILILSSNIFQNTQYNAWITINTQTAPQFSIYTQQYDINSTMKTYNQSFVFTFTLLTLDNEEIIFNNDVPWLIRLVFIKYQEYPIDIFREMLLIMKKTDQREIEKEKMQELREIAELEQRMSRFISY